MSKGVRGKRSKQSWQAGPKLMPQLPNNYCTQKRRGTRVTRSSHEEHGRSTSTARALPVGCLLGEGTAPRIKRAALPKVKRLSKARLLAPRSPAHAVGLSLYFTQSPAHLCIPVVRQARLQEGQNCVCGQARGADKKNETIVLSVFLVQLGKLV